MPSLIGALRISLGLETAAFEKGGKRAAAEVDVLGTRMEKAGFAVGRLTKTLAAGAAAFAGSAVIANLKDMAMRGLETASALGEQAQQLGVSTTALQFYRYAATQVGIEQAEMDKGLTTLTRKLGEFKNGTDKQRAGLEAWGFSQAEVARLTNLTAEQALPLLADKFAALKSPTDQAAFAAEFFGSKLGGKFATLLGDGSKGIEALAGAYKQLGIEISAADIAKADAAMDKMAQTQLVVQSRQAQIAAEHSDAVIKFGELWENAKLKMMDVAIKTTGAIDTIDSKLKEFSDWVKKVDQQLGIPTPGNGWLSAIQKNFAESFKRIGDFFTGIYDWTVNAPQWIATMVGKITNLIGTTLNAVWTTAQKRIEDVKKSFFGLYDAVVGHSYIPDMVDGIAAQMARLDGVMVDPAKAATKKTAEAFKALAAEVQPLLDRLFPEAAAANAYGKDFATLEAAQRAGMLDRGQTASALERLQNQYRNDNDAERSNPLAEQASSESLANLKALDAQLAVFAGTVAAAIPNLSSVGGLFGSIADGVEGMKNDLARSFTDVILHGENLGDSLVNVFDRFASKILDDLFNNLFDGILGGGGGGGLLGGVGKLLGFAEGTPSAPRGLAMVGERGPELVNFRGGERVWPNGEGPALGGGGNVYHISGNLLTPEFWAQIQRMDAGAAQAGSKMAIRDLGYRQSRSLG